MSSINYKNVYINDYYIIIGSKEKNGNIKKYDYMLSDFYFNCKTFEQAEMKMQKMVIENLLSKNNLSQNNISYLIGGDLQNQIGVTSYNASSFNIPFLGVYSACASMAESLSIGSNLIDSNNANNIICITSSHNLTAERQFRYPIEYGNCKPKTATSTATGAVGVMLSNTKSKIKIVSSTIGKVKSLGIKDTNHMGAVMAPACANTIYEHLTNNHKKANDYDLIITGDLGSIGLNILKDYYYNVYHEKINNIIDAGSQIYGEEDMKNISGASGPCALFLYFFGNIIHNKNYKKVLLVATGSLHNPVLVNQHLDIPSVAHAIEIEVLS